MSTPEKVVHLWTGLSSDWLAERDKDFLNDVLSKEEREQADRFAFDADRQVYSFAHGMLRHLLSRYEKGEPAGWKFARGSHGRPELVDDGEERSFRFNLSHTRGAAVVAVAHGVEVGVDIEALDRPLQALETVSRSWSKQEQSDLFARPETERGEYFLRVWTLKEAYIKARGLGLSLPLDQFSVSISTTGEIQFVPDADEANSDWRFWQSRCLTGYVIGLAWRGVARVELHSFTPGYLASPGEG